MDSETPQAPSPAPEKLTLEIEAPEIEPTEGRCVVKTNRNSTEEKEVLPTNKERDDSLKAFGAEAQILNDKVSKHLQENEAKTRSLRRGLLWLVLGPAFVIVLAAAVGGSVGGSLAALKSSKSSSSRPRTSATTLGTSATTPGNSATTPSTSLSTPSTSLTRRSLAQLSMPTSSPAAAISSTSLPLGHTGCNASNGTTHMSSGKAFIRICELDWSLATDDIVSGGINASTLDACIDSCTSWTGETCLGATFHFRYAISGIPGSCFLKTTLPSAATNLTSKGDVAAGYLAPT
ncbi:hypothetical protein N7G274_008689 [Stereocaulon virgatum]|uniref:Apple domain-containing protein n=1 Tax=Stereocaulon virgatum TaxID=373712 RepID=A0ABR4A0Y3_9LECA